jgi:ribosomal-protein-alanine N-acetyltransferase
MTQINRIQYLASQTILNMLSINFSPFPIIETERLLLRCLTMDDATTLFSLRTNKKVIEQFNRAPDESMEATKVKMKEILQLQEKNEAVLWVIAYKDDPAQMIGNIGYWRIVKEHYRAEIGYLLNPVHWKKGIMKEALNAVVDYAFSSMNLHSIEANINPDNIASGALLESCGFVKEAYYKENFYHDGVFYDSIIYSKLNRNR